MISLVALFLNLSAAFIVFGALVSKFYPRLLLLECVGIAFPVGLTVSAWVCLLGKSLLPTGCVPCVCCSPPHAYLLHVTSDYIFTQAWPVWRAHHAVCGAACCWRGGCGAQMPPRVHVWQPPLPHSTGIARCHPDEVIGLPVHRLGVVSVLVAHALVRCGN